MNAFKVVPLRQDHFPLIADSYAALLRTQYGRQKREDYLRSSLSGLAWRAFWKNESSATSSASLYALLAYDLALPLQKTVNMTEAQVKGGKTRRETSWSLAGVELNTPLAEQVMLGMAREGLCSVNFVRPEHVVPVYPTYPTDQDEENNDFLRLSQTKHSEKWSVFSTKTSIMLDQHAQNLLSLVASNLMRQAEEAAALAWPGPDGTVTLKCDGYEIVATLPIGEELGYAFRLPHTNTHPGLFFKTMFGHDSGLLSIYYANDPVAYIEVVSYCGTLYRLNSYSVKSVLFDSLGLDDYCDYSLYRFAALNSLNFLSLGEKKKHFTRCLAREGLGIVGWSDAVTDACSKAGEASVLDVLGDRHLKHL